MSFLHDTNGLALLRDTEAKAPLTVVLINNGGGGIFSFLPIADSVPADTFNQLWGTPQHVDVAGMLPQETCPCSAQRSFLCSPLCLHPLPPQHTGLCRAHGIPHTRVTGADALPAALSNGWALNGHSVVEVVTDRQHNVSQHQAVQVAVRGAVDAVLQRWVVDSKYRGVQDPEERPYEVPREIQSVDLHSYALPLARPLTVDAAQQERRGCLVRVALDDGRWGVGDCAPLPGGHNVCVRCCGQLCTRLHALMQHRIA